MVSEAQARASRRPPATPGVRPSGDQVGTLTHWGLSDLGDPAHRTVPVDAVEHVHAALREDRDLGAVGRPGRRLRSLQRGQPPGAAVGHGRPRRRRRRVRRRSTGRRATRRDGCRAQGGHRVSSRKPPPSSGRGPDPSVAGDRDPRAVGRPRRSGCRRSGHTAGCRGASGTPRSCATRFRRPARRTGRCGRCPGAAERCANTNARRPPSGAQTREPKPPHRGVPSIMATTGYGVQGSVSIRVRSMEETLPSRCRITSRASSSGPADVREVTVVGGQLRHHRTGARAAPARPSRSAPTTRRAPSGRARSPRRRPRCGPAAGGPGRAAPASPPGASARSACRSKVSRNRVSRSLIGPPRSPGCAAPAGRVRSTTSVPSSSNRAPAPPAPPRGPRSSAAPAPPVAAAPPSPAGARARPAPRRPSALHPAPPERPAGQVHDRAPQVGVERHLVAQLPEPPDDPHERVLHQVLGEGVVAGEQVRQAQRSRSVLLVQPRQVTPTHHAHKTPSTSPMLRSR